jgi:hypothetical protein
METSVVEVVMANKEAAMVVAAVAINVEASEEATEVATAVVEEATEVIVEVMVVTEEAEEALAEEIEAAMVVAKAVLLNNATVKTPALSVTSVKKLINAK